MSIDTTKLINVLNYNENPVAIKTHLKEYLCNAADIEGNPSINPLSFSEIESLNSNSNAFKIGILRFPEEIEAELYELLRIVDWASILTNAEIKDIILHPSPDGLTKFVEIKNASLFERVRGIFYSLKNSDEYDISNRVEAVISRRYKELANQQVKSSIEINKKDVLATAVNEEVNALKQKNESMQTQMEEMKKMMEQMMAMQLNTTTSHTITETVESKSAEEPKKTGRQTNKSSK